MTAHGVRDSSGDTVRQRAARIVEEFGGLDDHIQRYRYLVDLGERMPRLPEEDRTEDNYIPGCQYDIWIRVDYDPDDGVLHFRSDSNAKITRGLAALIIRVLDGQPPAAILDAQLEFLDRIGLRAQLSAKRENGLQAMIHEMKRRAREYTDDNDDLH